MKKTSRRQHTKPTHYAVVGGKALGEGTFGCVLPVNPATMSGTCKIDYNKYKVSKIFVSPDHADEELQQANMLKDVPGIDDYAILPKDHCLFKLKDITNPEAKQNLISDCQRLNPQNLVNDFEEDGENVELAQLFYSEQGTTLSEFWKNQASIDFNLLLTHFINLSKGLKIFEKHEFLHKDIKPGNIIVPNHNPQKAKYIDFGYLTDFTTFSWYFSAHMAKYPYWAPELYYDLPSGRDYVTIRNTAYTKKDIDPTVRVKNAYGRNSFIHKLSDNETNLSIYKRNQNYITNFIVDTVEDRVKELPSPKERVYDPSVHLVRPRPGQLEDLITKDIGKVIYKNASSPFLSKIDMYSLGVTIMDILDIVGHKMNVAEPSGLQLQELQALAKQMMNVNPEVRPSPSQLTRKLTKMLTDLTNTNMMGGKRRPPSKTKAQSTPKTKASSKAKAPAKPCLKKRTKSVY